MKKLLYSALGYVALSGCASDFGSQFSAGYISVVGASDDQQFYLMKHYEYETEIVPMRHKGDKYLYDYFAIHKHATPAQGQPEMQESGNFLLLYFCKGKLMKMNVQVIPQKSIDPSRQYRLTCS